MIPYIKDSWRGGISDEYTKGAKGSFKYAYGCDIHKRRDSISCNYAMNTIADTTKISDLIKYSVTARDGSTYCFGSAGSIYAISGNADDPAVTYCYNDENGEIRGAAEWQEQSGTNYLYWATATSIARVALGGSLDTPWGSGVATQDYKTTLDNHEYHTMKSANGRLCIANGYFLASIAYDGSFNPATANIRPGNKIKCLEERDDYIIIGSERTDNAEEGYIWGYIVGDLAWNQKRKIPVRGINALIDSERLLLQGGTDGEIFFSDFQNVSPLNAVFNGGTCNTRVDAYNDLALFGMYDTDDPINVGIYSFGRKMLNRPFAFNNEFRLSNTVAGSTVSEIGAVWVSGSIPFASWKTTDGSTINYGVDMMSKTTRATARLDGLEWNGGRSDLKKHYHREKVIFEPLPAGTSINVIYKTDRDTTDYDQGLGLGWRYALLSDMTSTSYAETGATETEFMINDEAQTFEIGIILNPSGTSTPEITGMVGSIGDTPKDY